MNFDEKYWSQRWKNDETGWDIGHASPPLAKYCKQIKDKNCQILLPGAGNAYEGVLLYELGFKNTHIVDISAEPLQKIAKEHSIVAKENLIHIDFFDLDGKYDLILEQTFFCALDPGLRKAYFKKCYDLLKPKGKLVGVLFNDTLNTDHPPFGGFANDYKALFEDLFTIKTYEPCYNSIKPRENREWFMILVKKS